MKKPEGGETIKEQKKLKSEKRSKGRGQLKDVVKLEEDAGLSGNLRLKEDREMPRRNLDFSEEELFC